MIACPREQYHPSDTTTKSKRSMLNPISLNKAIPRNRLRLFSNTSCGFQEDINLSMAANLVSPHMRCSDVDIYDTIPRKPISTQQSGQGAVARRRGKQFLDNNPVQFVILAHTRTSLRVE